MSDTASEVVKPEAKPLYIIDDHTKSVFAGTPSDALVKLYDEQGGSILATPKVDRDGNTVWDAIDLDSLPPGPTPGEYRMIFLSDDV